MKKLKFVKSHQHKHEEAKKPLTLTCPRCDTEITVTIGLYAWVQCPVCSYEWRPEGEDDE